MNTKRARRMMETIVAGARPPREKLGGLAVDEIMDIYQAYQQNLATTRARESTNKRKVFRPRAVLNMFGKTIAWRPQPFDNDIPEMAKATIRELRLKTTNAVEDADFVVTTAGVGELEQHVRWHLYLIGGALISLDYLTSRGKEGSCLIFKPAVESKVMQIWTSARFVAQNPVAYAILDRAIGSTKSKWKWFVGNNVEFLSRALRTKSLVGLVTHSEHNAFPQNFVQCMTSNMFLTRFCILAPETQTCESRSSEAGTDGGRRGAPGHHGVYEQGIARAASQIVRHASTRKKDGAG